MTDLDHRTDILIKVGQELVERFLLILLSGNILINNLNNTGVPSQFLKFTSFCGTFNTQVTSIANTFSASMISSIITLVDEDDWGISDCKVVAEHKSMNWLKVFLHQIYISLSWMPLFAINSTTLSPFLSSYSSTYLLTISLIHYYYFYILIYTTLKQNEQFISNKYVTIYLNLNDESLQCWSFNVILW